MVETFQAQYVSLHVRISNEAAKRLYRDTLGFETVETVKKYYADGEDALSMKLDLGYVREEIMDEEGEAEDEGEPVGELGKAGDDGLPKEKKSVQGKKRKVRVGRGLGVGELVEKNESQKAN